MTTTPTTRAEMPSIVQRYKIGYASDAWGERSSTPSGIPDAAGKWVRYEDYVAALSAAAPAAQAARPAMPETWHVVAHIKGEPVLSIGYDWVSGRELASEEEHAIVGMAQHLLSFVGYGLPPSDFNPDDAAPQAQQPGAAYAELPNPEIVMAWSSWDESWVPTKLESCLKEAPDDQVIGYTADQMRAFADATSAARAGAQAVPFQPRVQPWLMQCFGAEIAADRAERNHRFLEESLELVQSCGCTASEAHQLVDYVFGRPPGEPAQETGGVMVTLAALCLANSLDMHQAGETELARIWTKVEAIRAKQAAKPKHSPLPAAPAAVRAPKLPSHEELAELLASGLRGTWHCGRAWEAWHVGTMSEDDFSPVDESDTPGELADAVLALLAAAPQAPAPAQEGGAA